VNSNGIQRTTVRKAARGRGERRRERPRNKSNTNPRTEEESAQTTTISRSQHGMITTCWISSSSAKRYLLLMSSPTPHTVDLCPFSHTFTYCLSTLFFFLNFLPRLQDCFFLLPGFFFSFPNFTFSFPWKISPVEKYENRKSANFCPFKIPRISIVLIKRRRDFIFLLSDDQSMYAIHPSIHIHSKKGRKLNIVLISSCLRPSWWSPW